jgi:hypothetical protein
MHLTKMKRCQKATYGYKGQFTGENLFSEVEQLRLALGAIPEMVETKKHPGVKVPGWFINLEPAAGGRWGAGAGNNVTFKVYVNDDTLLPALDLMQEGAVAPAEPIITPTATSAALARLMSRPGLTADNIELPEDRLEVSGDLTGSAE